MRDRGDENDRKTPVPVLRQRPVEEEPSEFETGFYWMGRPLSDMTRAELVGVIRYLTEKNANYLSPENIEARAIGRAAQMRRRMSSV